MERLAVIGNVSRDRTYYPDHRGGTRLGGAALLVSLASTSAGRRAAPVCVLGNDLAHLPGTPGLNGLDWSAHRRADGLSASFELTYDADGELVTASAGYGVAQSLTAHALAYVDGHLDDTYHVCCRRPLDADAVLSRLALHGVAFSVDFFVASADEMIRAAARWLPEAATVFVNAAEYRLLNSVLRTADLPEVIVTDGPRAAQVRHFGRQTASVLPPPRSTREVSGAGDTLAGTFLALRTYGATPCGALTGAVAAAAEYVLAPPLPIPAPRPA